MKTYKSIATLFILLFVFIKCQGSGLSHNELDSDIDVFCFSVEFYESAPSIKPVDCFEHAELITGTSAEILRGLAATESFFKVEAVGDNGMSHGMFQLHSRWQESRVEKWGEFDPNDPFESAVIAGRIMQENLIALNGDLRMAIAAYRQGVSGALTKGINQRYVDDVLNWRGNSQKVVSYIQFSSASEGSYKTLVYLPIGR